MNGFKDLGLSDDILQTLEKKGFENPTPVQTRAIPVILQEDQDVLAQAQTGTGKTAAFGLPLIQKLSPAKKPQAIILTPTRELAIQVSEELHSFKGKKKLSIVPIYGGQSYTLQLRHLKKGVDIVVGTPGRVIDHINRKTLKLDEIQYVALDEADEMLNMGFLEEIQEILKHTPDDKRTLLFSATMPKNILKIAEKYMKQYTTIKIKAEQLTTENTNQIYFEVKERNKFEALCRIIDVEDDFYGLVFCRTKNDVDDITQKLNERGYDADGLHGDISQSLRTKIMNKMKKRQIEILVATDVAARGIDVQDLTHVINYSIPYNSEAYVHRIGRTGRAGKEGNAITFITPKEYRQFQTIKRKTNTDIEKGKLPGVDEIIKLKKDRIAEDLNEMIEKGSTKQFQKMSDQLLDEYTPEEIIASLLQHTFGEELDVTNYREIEEPRFGSRDEGGKTRLFISQGKKDGMTAKKIVSIIEKQCNISKRKIRDVQVLEKFSFVSMPFQDAEIVLDYFKKNKRRNKLNIVKAKAKR